MKMFSSLNELLGRLPRWAIIAAAAVVLAIVGALDYVTGSEIGLSIFYVIPVMLMAWYLGKAAGIVTSFLAAAAWYVAEVATGHVYSNAIIPVWNAVVRLGFFMMISLLISVIKSVLAQEQDLARTDSLTGVLNSRHFYELAEVELDRAKRYGRPFSIAYLDLDNFKEVNDVYGHGTGDDLLCFVAGTIKGNMRASDFIARLGGDEFADSTKNAVRHEIVENDADRERIAKLRPGAESG